MIAVYDTMARAVTGVRPADARTLTMYTCGPTVYRYAHIGNLRTFLMADLVRRAFEYAGVEVRQVQNITDVGHMTDELFDRGEDKMLVAAGIENRSPKEIADYYTAAFLEDVRAMNIRPAADYPRASEYVPQMIKLVARLLERGHAYERDGTVYFDVRSFPGYGRLSGNTIDRLRPDHRKEIADPNKRHHADFVLWMRAGPDRAIRFPSPWGEGYPGWHIECSAMSMALLGESFDLHTGGVDNIFPHHEDEIAQSEGATGHRVVRHWLHGEHLLAEGRKMSKSAGNFYDLRDLAARGHGEPLAVRLLFLQCRYRAQMNFTMDALGAAERALTRWRRLVAGWTGAPLASPSHAAAAYEDRFRALIAGDLDTPATIALVSEVVASADLGPGDKAALLARWDAVLGLDLARDADASPPIPAEALELVARREEARLRRDWAEADGIRRRLAELGVQVEDTPEGPKPRRGAAPTTA
ncbi:MAG: cysteine--tRNA ligase [Acidobacteria bacterium]|nr:cysteine--tRNA ligase [Acidobacteriota bacterium]